VECRDIKRYGKERFDENLVAYYSLTGHTRMIAEIIAELTNAELLELKPKKAFPQKGS
jgi:flavodoxin